MAAGSTGLEMDVHCTADGVLVVCHDATVDRTTPVSGVIADMEWAQLQELDNAHWWVPGEEAVNDRHPDEYLLRGRAPEDHSLGIALLSEVLDEFRGVFLNLDIKGTEPKVPGYERQLADVLRTYERTDDVIVASFHDVAIQKFRSLAPDIATSLAMIETITAGQTLRNGGSIEVTPNQVALQVPYLLKGVAVLDAATVDAAHAHGLAVHVWTIDEPQHMTELLAMDVDGIISDKPSVLQCVLDSR